jgi:monovalent cation/proton antiporter MnhG/PhaG subunit
MSESLLSLMGAVVSLLGALFFLVSAVGLLRLPEFYTRAHAPAKAATVGMLLVAAGSIVTDGLGDAAYWLEKVLLVLFALITVPISTQVLVRSAAARGIRQMPRTQGARTTPPPART